MQNTNYFRIIKSKILKFLGLCLVPSKMLKFSGLDGGCEGSFRVFWPLDAKIRLKYKIANILPKKFKWRLVLLCKMMGQNLKIFYSNGELNMPIYF